ncbi:MAG TPA: enoyl-CoA hydratase/isomerase family protein [Alphaproteobacteria bacterium]
MSAPLALTRDGPIAHLQLNRPERLNAIDRSVCESLIAQLDALEADGDARVLVLSGVGDRAFSSGADLKHMRGLEGADLRRFIELTWVAFERLASSPLPSIAVLHGYVLGGGLELALACDFRIADATVQIGLPEMTLGSVPGSGALQRLPALIGPARAAELAMLGRHLDAAEAAEIGLVNRVTLSGEAIALALEWAMTLAERPPEALRYAKIALRLGASPAVAAAFHGLVSDSCHRARDYRSRTEKFVSASDKSGGDRK